MELVGWPAPLALLIPDRLFGESWGARHELVVGGGVVLVTSSAGNDDDEFMVRSWSVAGPPAPPPPRNRLPASWVALRGPITLECECHPNMEAAVRPTPDEVSSPVLSNSSRAAAAASMICYRRLWVPIDEILVRFVVVDGYGVL